MTPQPGKKGDKLTFMKAMAMKIGVEPEMIIKMVPALRKDGFSSLNEGRSKSSGGYRYSRELLNKNEKETRWYHNLI